MPAIVRRSERGILGKQSAHTFDLGEELFAEASDVVLVVGRRFA